ncbi:MAG: hypothetical protein PVH61_19235 [Candidatus Aminicenantes bacterium]|jgi:hypothetical protein
MHDSLAVKLFCYNYVLIETCGDLVTLRASPESYDEVSRAKVWQMKNRNKYPNTQPLCCWIASVLCNGKIYVRNTYGEIACIDVTI